MGARGAVAVLLAAAVTLVASPAAPAIPYDATGAIPYSLTPPPTLPDPGCTQSYDDLAPTDRGAPIVWGIGPQLSGDAGVGQSASTPEDPALRDAALRALEPPHAPFVVRLNRMFESAGSAGIRSFQLLADHYGELGLDVLLQVRYHPSAAENGNIPAWLRYVRQVVDAFGPDRHVVGLQITNEVNLAVSPNTSDGAYRNADEALVQGVIAAKQQAQRRHFGQLTIGFNYAPTVPTADVTFFRTLGQLGGAQFTRSVDWVGTDLYPGTFFPPLFVNAGDAVIESIASLRRCELPAAGIGAGTPIVVTELGYPTGPGRSDAEQVSAVTGFVDALNAYRGVYDISSVNFFDLRDNDSSSPSFQAQYGLLRDDYAPKPAFSVYQHLVRAFSPAGPVASPLR